jgi:lysophospholipase L1-like esterase
LGSQLILPDFILPSRVNQCWEYSGIDSFERCLDKNHFKQYPHAVIYNYNSRGFRDQEWPDSSEELKQAIWCIGDSFTAGIGSPIEHTWPWLLQKQTGRRVINISMDGASNNWIARRTNLIQKEINPTNIVVMWSYLHRRESDNQKVSDEQRIIQSINSTNNEDASNFADCINLIKNNSVTQLIIPEYAPESTDIQALWDTVRGTNWPVLAPNTMDAMNLLPKFIQTELKEYFKIWTDLQTMIELQQTLSPIDKNIIKVNRLDLARDGHHFDIITAQWIVDQIADGLNQQN